VVRVIDLWEGVEEKPLCRNNPLHCWSTSDCIPFANPTKLMFLLRRSLSTTALKSLRESTGAPLIECKRALTENNGDLELATKWLFERSKQAKSKLASRSTKQGLVGLELTDNAAALAEVQCETDFVAALPEFQALVREQTKCVLVGKPLPADTLTAVVGKVRENILLGQTQVLQNQPNQSVFGSYIHNNISANVGSSAAVVSLTPGTDPALARQLAVHIVGIKPVYLTKDEIPQETVEKERSRIVEESKAIFEGKSDKAREQVVKSKLNNFFQEKCLMEQSFVFGEFEGKLVRDVLKGKGTIQGFIRLSVGGV
jgi:elongation factor Ts